MVRCLSSHSQFSSIVCLRLKIRTISYRASSFSCSISLIICHFEVLKICSLIHACLPGRVQFRFAFASVGVWPHNSSRSHLQSVLFAHHIQMGNMWSRLVFHLRASLMWSDRYSFYPASPPSPPASEHPLPSCLSASVFQFDLLIVTCLILVFSDNWAVHWWISAFTLNDQLLIFDIIQFVVVQPSFSSSHVILL